MRAKRWLIDTLLVLSLCLARSLSLQVQLCRGALLSIDLQLLTHSEFFKVQFSKTIFLTVLRAWITAHLFLRRRSCRTGTQKLSKGKKGLKCIVSLFFTPSMFTSDKLTKYNHSSIALRVLSVFTTDRLTKVQSQQACSDLETVLMRNPKSPLFRACSRAALEVPYQILSWVGGIL